MKDFDRWFRDSTEKAEPNMVRALTPEAQFERDEFEHEYGAGNCSCHLNIPCRSCTHPGNPLNQDEDETAWMLVPEDES